MSDVKYDRHYREDPAACGEPFAEFAQLAETVAKGTVLDLGCGQGRDALMFARAGHRVVGVDVSAVGIAQLLATARREALDVEGVVQDISTWERQETFDLVILDRVLHMLPEGPRMAALATAMSAVTPGGHLLVAEGPKGMIPVRQAVDAQGWVPVRATRNRLIAQRPA